MSQPTFQQVHQDVPLTNLSIAFFQDPSNYGIMNIFPRVPVPNASDKYYTYDRSYWLASYAQKRAAGTPAPLGGYAVGTSTFTVDRDSMAKAVDDPSRANADPQIDLERDATRWVSAQVALKMEQRFATAFFGTGIWTGSSSGSDITPSVTWDDAASTPIKDIKDQMRAMTQNVGPDYMANVLALGAKTYDDLSQHPDIIDRIKFTSSPGNPAIVNEQSLAQLFGVRKIVVLRAVQNTAGEGQTASYSYIANSRSAMLVYAAPSPSLFAPSAGYTFMWTGAPDGSAFGPAIKRWRDEKIESDIIEANCWYKPYVISSILGTYFSNAVAA